MSTIHPQLLHDCIVLGSFPLSWLLLNKDAHYPWFILVPNRPDIGEIYQLNANDQKQLLQESSGLAEALVQTFAADKLNIAALGNIVPQLHLHHIVRYRHDIAWPAPVWGYAPAKPYETQHLELLKQKIMAMSLPNFDDSLRP